MIRTIGLALSVVGTAMVAVGISASDSISSEFSRLFSGHPTNYSLWMLLGGLVLVVLGTGGWMSSGSRPNRA